MTEWIGGRRPVAEALVAGREAHRLILSATAKPAPELRAITDAARRIRLPIDRVPADQMTRIAGFDGHQGVLLEVGERRWTEVGEMLAHAREGGRDPLSWSSSICRIRPTSGRSFGRPRPPAWTASSFPSAARRR